MSKNGATHNDVVVQTIKTAIPDAIQEVVDFRGERTLIVEPGQLRPVCQLLRDHGYDLLEDVVADDMFPDHPRFAVSYHLYSLPKNHQVRLRVLVEDPENGPETIGAVWPVATWLEMEVWDLMGVRFAGNNGLRRLFMPEDWVGFPLRKDYPVGYEEVQFSFNWEAIDARKPYAQE